MGCTNPFSRLPAKLTWKRGMSEGKHVFLIAWDGKRHIMDVGWVCQGHADGQPF